MSAAWRPAPWAEPGDFHAHGPWFHVARIALVAALAVATCACARGEAAQGGHRAPAADHTAQDAGHGERAAGGAAQDAGPGEHGRKPAYVTPDSLRHREPGALHTVAGEPVHGRTGPGGQPFEVALRTTRELAPHARRYGTRTLDITLRTRTPDLSQYPCTACHMGRKTTIRDERVEDAHRNVPTQHPRETGAGCATCHAADNVELLALENGERATLDHAYRLCAQCHFQQVEAWAGGGHGKRLDGWQGRRVVMGCADCHDPHQPALSTRLPFKPPRLHRSREP